MHKDLLVWEKSKELIVLVYNFTDQLPQSENFGLKSQMKRAVISVLSNIAEGAARGSRQDYCRFLYYSLGSVSEIDAQYEACLSLNIADRNITLEDKLDHVGKLLTRLIKSLK